MKTFWICLGVIVGLLCSAFVGCTITANVKGHSNVVDWAKTWPVFQSDEKTEEVEENVEVELPEDESGDTTAVIKY